MNPAVSVELEIVLQVHCSTTRKNVYECREMKNALMAAAKDRRAGPG